MSMFACVYMCIYIYIYIYIYILERERERDSVKLYKEQAEFIDLTM